MGKCPKCGVQLGEDETIQWQCSSCNCKQSWNLDKFTKAIRAKQYQVDMNKQNMTNNATKTNKTKKYPVIILSVLLVISLIANGALFFQFNDTQQKLSKNIIDNTNNEVILLNSKLERTQANLIASESDFNKLNQSYESLNQRYQKVSNALSDCKNKVSKRQSRIDELKGKINDKNIKISNLQSKISSLKSDKKSLQSRLSTRRNSNSSSSSSTSSAYTVYVTDYGEKYHRAGCRYLWNSSSAISLSDAKAAGYTPCSICNP